MSEQKENSFKTWYAVSFAFQLGFFIIIPIVGFVLFGLWVDKKFQTAPLFIILGVFAGIIVTVYEVHHLLAPLLKKHD